MKDTVKFISKINCQQLRVPVRHTNVRNREHKYRKLEETYIDRQTGRLYLTWPLYYTASHSIMCFLSLDYCCFHSCYCYGRCELLQRGYYYTYIHGNSNVYKKEGARTYAIQLLQPCRASHHIVVSDSFLVSFLPPSSCILNREEKRGKKITAELANMVCCCCCCCYLVARYKRWAGQESPHLL